jgi:hypothetical protein
VEELDAGPAGGRQQQQVRHLLARRELLERDRIRAVRAIEPKSKMSLALQKKTFASKFISLSVNDSIIKQ